MQIKSIVLRQVHVPLRRRGSYSTGWVDPEWVNIVVEVSDGIHKGYGEFAPTSILYPPTITVGRSTLDEWQELQTECAKLLGKDARGLRSLIPPNWECQDASGMVDAVDFALHDLVGKAKNLPVWALLGVGHAPWRWGMPVVHHAPVDEMVALAQSYYRRYGYRWYKLKPRCNFDEDARVMRKIRECTTPEARFYIDPNYSLKMDPDGVVDYLNRLENCGLECCEDPINTDWATYRYIKSRTKIRLMLDEKVRAPQRVVDAVTERCASLINVHANWAGGFRVAMLKADIALLGGMHVMIGSGFYLGFANAAYQILASVLPGDVPCEQVNGDDYGTRLAVKRQFRCEDGKIHIPDLPGIGVEADSDALEELTFQKIVLN